jgi:hypothetical protein
MPMLRTQSAKGLRTQLGMQFQAANLREFMAEFQRQLCGHHGIGQLLPPGVRHHDMSNPIIISPVLGGLHADYRRAA